ncbi:MAG: DUF6206 family protein [Ilumatobacteraceae bacterium]
MTAAGGVDLPDLEQVEAAIGSAIRTRTSHGVRLLGHGEISIVLGWPAEQPQHALKRVPPFRTQAAAEQYIAVCEAFLAHLSGAGVPILHTTLHTTTRADGAVVVFHRQPVADSVHLGTNVLRSTAPDADHPLLAAIVSHAQAVVEDRRIGFDVQAANWLWDGQTARQLDFTSPFVLNDTGDDLQFDTTGFLREYPAALRGYLKKELLALILRYTRPEGAIGDMVGNLFKEDLEPWVDPAIEAARRAGVVIRREDAQKMYDDDRKLLPLTLRMKKGQRWWLQHTGRRYDSMLPERTTYER